MEKGINKIVDIWREAYSHPLKEKKPYQSTDQLRQIAAMFSPGRTFYYILNFHNLEFEFISDEVEEITGLDKHSVTMQDLLSLALDLPVLQLKENVVQDFAINHTDDEELMDYKFIYTYRLQKPGCDPQIILLQNIALSTSEEGNVQHALGIHTDVTHLKPGENNTVSIMHLKGGKSFYNLSIEGGIFDPSTASISDQYSEKLTSRELEIAKLMAKGMSAEQIAENLHISFHTVRTHRNNMLKKMNCANSTELVVRCVTKGLISI